MLAVVEQVVESALIYWQKQMVPAARVELAPHCWDMNLNHARLPIPPRGHRGNP